jgi:hypothetical protein
MPLTHFCMRALFVSPTAHNNASCSQQTCDNGIAGFHPHAGTRFQSARFLLALFSILFLLTVGARLLSAQAVTITNVYQNHYNYTYPIGDQNCPSGYDIPSGQYSSTYHLERGHAIHHADPKNASNDYWVYWAHFDNGSYTTAEVAIFKSTTECGPYTLQTNLYPSYNTDGSGYGFQPGGWQSRDEIIFEDNNQTYNAAGTVNTYASAYLVSASDSENTVVSSPHSQSPSQTCSYANDSDAIFKMTPDYLGIDATTNPSTNGANWVFVCDQREAPVMFKKNNEYFLIVSQAAGWYPSQGAYGASSNPLTGWTPDPIPFSNTNTYGGQGSNGFTINGTTASTGTDATTYVLTFDHLGGADSKNPASSELYDTGEIWLPVILDDVARTATLNWYPSWTVDNTTGVLTLPTLTDLAPGGTASSTVVSQSAYPVSNATDGNYFTLWQELNSGNAAFAPLATATSTLCPVTGATDATTCYPSLVVDLGEVYPVQEIDLSQYYVKGSETYYTYKIAYSSDDVNWTTLDYTTFNSAPNAATQNISDVPFTNNITYGFNFLPVDFSARYVALEEISSVVQNQGSSYTWYSPGLWEMGIIESTAPASPQPVDVVVTPSPSSTTSSSTPITVGVTVTGPEGYPTPTGYVQLSAPGYVSDTYGLVNGSTSFTIPGSSLPNGTFAITASYRPDPTSTPVYGIGATTGSGGETEPPFSLSATAASVTAGSTGTSTVTETVAAGFNSPVTLTASALPPGVTAAFTPPSIVGAGTSTLTFTAAANAPAGTTTVTVTGTPASGTAETTTLTLTVLAAGSYTELINENSGLCLSAVNTNEGQGLEQVACSSSPLLEWQLSTEGSGYYLKNEDTGYVVDVGGQSKSPGAGIDDWALNGGTNQEWTFTSKGSGYYTLTNVNSGLCLDVPGASAASGASIDQWTCNGGTNQLWKLSFPPAFLTITPTAATATYGGTATLNASATFTAGTPPTGALVFEVNGGSPTTGTCSISGTTQTCTATYSLGNLAVGSYIVYVFYDGDANYAASFTSTTLTIGKAASTTVVTGGSFPYNGTAHGATVSVTGAGGLSLTPAPTYSGSCTSAPVTVAQGSACTASYTYAGDSNHNGSSGSALVIITPDAALTLQVSNTQLVYPGAANTTVCVAPATKAVATGTVQIVDGLNDLVTENLQGNGCAYWYISPGLAAGTHTLVAFYSGDTNNHPEESAAVVVIVNPVQVNLSASCWNASFPYGANYQCTINASSNAGAAQGVVSATYDGTPLNAIPLSGDNAQLSISDPVVGNHTLAISYAPQGNFAGAGRRTFNFTVTPAPVNVALSPSSWYSPVGSSLTFSVTISSWSAGPPNATGSVSFYDGSALLTTVPVNSNGGASYTTTALSAGSHTIKATYSGGTNYASGSASVTITLAP